MKICGWGSVGTYNDTLNFTVNLSLQFFTWPQKGGNSVLIHFFINTCIKLFLVTKRDPS